MGRCYGSVKNVQEEQLMWTDRVESLLFINLAATFSFDILLPLPVGELVDIFIHST